MDLFDGEGQAPLHKAVLYNQLEAVQVLAMNGVDLNTKDPLGNTALHVSAWWQHATQLSSDRDIAGNNDVADNSCAKREML